MNQLLLRLKPVYKGVVLERVGRFVVRVIVDGNTVLAHNTNTGRLLDIVSPGKKVLLIPIKSKLKYRLVGVEDTVANCYSVVDVITQSRAFERSTELGLLPYLRGCYVVKRNPAVYGSRLDYALKCGHKEVLVETKSAVMRGPGGEAMYPDCETVRGKKHLKVLVELASTGATVYLIFVSAMCSVRCFKPNEEGDREVSVILREAIRRGVIVKSISIYMSNCGYVYLGNPEIPLCLEDDSQLQ